jgi:hypothetical protein
MKSSPAKNTVAIAAPDVATTDAAASALTLTIALTAKQAEAITELAEWTRCTPEEILKASAFYGLQINFESGDQLRGAMLDTLNAMEADHIEMGANAFEWCEVRRPAKAAQPAAEGAA